MEDGYVVLKKLETKIELSKDNKKVEIDSIIYVVFNLNEVNKKEFNISIRNFEFTKYEI